MLRLYDNSPQKRDYMRILECNEVVLFLHILLLREMREYMLYFQNTK